MEEISTKDRERKEKKKEGKMNNKGVTCVIFFLFLLNMSKLSTCVIATVPRLKLLSIII